MKHGQGLLVFVIQLLFFCSGCGQRHAEDEILAAMQRYDHLIQKVDADSIALLYTTDGELGAVAKGRDSIRKFLASFKNTKVLSQASATDSISMQGDGAVQKGRYKQVAVVAGDTFRISGGYDAAWQWIPSEGWRIKRMTTRPDR